MLYHRRGIHMSHGIDMSHGWRLEGLQVIVIVVVRVEVVVVE